MRKYFFEKGEDIKINELHFILALQKLDSQAYMLERVENPLADYVYEQYRCFGHSNFVRYVTSWEQIEKVEHRKDEPTKLPEPPKNKKKSSLTSFLNRKKNESAQPPNQPSSTQSKKKIETSPAQLKDVRVFYIQLEEFTNITIPSQIIQIKHLLTILYLMAKSVINNCGICPYMIPVLDNDEKLRFIKKGSQFSGEFVNLFEYLMKDKQINIWSEQVNTLYQQYRISGKDSKKQRKEKLTEALIKQIQELFINNEYNILIIQQGSYKAQKCRIIGPEQILLVETDQELKLSDLQVSMQEKSKTVTQFILQDKVLEPISLEISMESSDFLIKFLRTFCLY